MTTDARFTATIDGAHFTLTGPTWSNTYRVDRLDEWIAFYSSRPAKYAHHYAATLAALKALKANLQTN